MLDGLGANAYGDGGIESSKRAAYDEQLSLTSVLANDKPRKRERSYIRKRYSD